MCRGHFHLGKEEGIRKTECPVDILTGILRPVKQIRIFFIRIFDGLIPYSKDPCGSVRESEKGIRVVDPGIDEADDNAFSLIGKGRYTGCGKDSGGLHGGGV